MRCCLRCLDIVFVLYFNLLKLCIWRCMLGFVLCISSPCLQRAIHANANLYLSCAFLNLRWLDGSQSARANKIARLTKCCPLSSLRLSVRRWGLGLILQGLDHFSSANLPPRLIPHQSFFAATFLTYDSRF